MRRRITIVGIVVIACVSFFISTASADPHEVRLPLHEGRLHTPDLAAAVSREMRLPVFSVAGGDINLTTVRGSLCLRAFNAALGDGCQLRIDNDALVLRVDPEKLPRHADDAKKAIRVFTTEADPQAAAQQALNWGIFIPDKFDSRRPLLLLVHGLDSERSDLYGIAAELIRGGFQVGYFAYPDDQPIEESGRFLADQMANFRRQYPGVTVNIVAHSMGGLVARSYIEGKAYAGGVDHLLMVGTPNAGSRWASARILLEIAEQYRGWKHDPHWRWTWAITDGLGEAGRDLTPGSEFLAKLNAGPRRAGVKYTIIAGCQAPTCRYSAEAADAAVHLIPRKAAQWWGVRQCASAIEKCGEHCRTTTCSSDGPVTLQSVKLAGVRDVVVLPADHITLICPDHGHAPAALAVIEDRLAR